MKNEMLKNQNALSFDELDQVSAATVGELNEIISAMEDVSGTAGKVSGGLRKVLGFLPYEKVGTSAYNLIMAPVVEKGLKSELGIDANTSIGWLGSDFRSSHNTYKLNGKAISHQEVLNMIKSA